MGIKNNSSSYQNSWFNLINRKDVPVKFPVSYKEDRAFEVKSNSGASVSFNAKQYDAEVFENYKLNRTGRNRMAGFITPDAYSDKVSRWRRYSLLKPNKMSNRPGIWFDYKFSRHLHQRSFFKVPPGSFRISKTVTPWMLPFRNASGTSAFFHKLNKEGRFFFPTESYNCKKKIIPPARGFLWVLKKILTKKKIRRKKLWKIPQIAQAVLYRKAFSGRRQSIQSEPSLGRFFDAKSKSFVARASAFSTFMDFGNSIPVRFRKLGVEAAYSVKDRKSNFYPPKDKISAIIVENGRTDPASRKKIYSEGLVRHPGFRDLMSEGFVRTSMYWLHSSAFTTGSVDEMQFRVPGNDNYFEVVAALAAHRRIRLRHMISNRGLKDLGFKKPGLKRLKHFYKAELLPTVKDKYNRSWVTSSAVANALVADPAIENVFFLFRASAKLRRYNRRWRRSRYFDNNRWGYFNYKEWKQIPPKYYKGRINQKWLGWIAYQRRKNRFKFFHTLFRRSALIKPFLLTSSITLHRSLSYASLKRAKRFALLRYAGARLRSSLVDFYNRPYVGGLQFNSYSSAILAKHMESADLLYNTSISRLSSESRRVSLSSFLDFSLRSNVLGLFGMSSDILDFTKRKQHV